MASSTRAHPSTRVPRPRYNDGFLRMSNHSTRSFAREQQYLTPIFPSEFEREEASMERKVGGNSAREDPGTRVTKPRYGMDFSRNEQLLCLKLCS